MIKIEPLEPNLGRYLAQFEPGWAQLQQRVIGPHCKVPPIPYRVVQQKVIQS